MDKYFKEFDDEIVISKELAEMVKACDSYLLNLEEDLKGTNGFPDTYEEYQPKNFAPEFNCLGVTTDDYLRDLAISGQAMKAYSPAYFLIENINGASVANPELVEEFYFKFCATAELKINGIEYPITDGVNKYLPLPADSYQGLHVDMESLNEIYQKLEMPVVDKYFMTEEQDAVYSFVNKQIEDGVNYLLDRYVIDGEEDGQFNVVTTVKGFFFVDFDDKRVKVTVDFDSRDAEDRGLRLWKNNSI